MKRIAVAVVLALVVTGYALLLWKGPWWVDGNHLRSKNLQPADGVVITGFRTMLVALGAGAVAALGLWYTHKGHKQTEALFEHTRQKDREQAELTREGQVTDRYVEAIKLLASASPTERLGGIYALERIMRDSEKDYDTVVQVLSAYIRHSAPVDAGSEPAPEPGDRRPSDDLQAALSVLGRRPKRAEEKLAVDLRRTDLRGAGLVGANLRGALLIGANLEGADLGAADLSAAHLTSARVRRVNLTGARLERASMKGADLEGTWMVHACLKGAHLTGASLKDAYLRKADLREVGGLEIDQLLDARIYSATRLPSRLASDQRIEARITECEAIQGLPTLLTGEWAPEPLPDRP